MSDLRFPIGEFKPQQSYTREETDLAIDEIESTPRRLRDAIAGLTEEQLDTPYRPDGWTSRQVVHHMPDSHMNSYIRFKLAMTEDDPTIRPYREERWAETPDGKHGDPEMSLTLLEAVHRRLVVFLRTLTDEDLRRTFQHPEVGPLDLATTIAMYAWHGNHHIAHITTLREREGWVATAGSTSS